MKHAPTPEPEPEVLTRAYLDRDLSGDDDMLYFVCDDCEDGQLWASYQPGVLTLTCSGCNECVAKIAVA